MKRLFIGYFVGWWLLWLITTNSLIGYNYGDVRNSPLMVGILVGISNIISLTITYTNIIINNTIRGP